MLELLTIIKKTFRDSELEKDSVILNLRITDTDMLKKNARSKLTAPFPVTKTKKVMERVKQHFTIAPENIQSELTL